MNDRPDWNEWILQKNAECEAEELKKSDGVTLEKAVKRNALQRLARDLAPHADRLNIHHLDSNLQQSGTPHPDGLVGFDVEHDEKNRDAVNRILEAHGHFNHPGAFGEDIETGGTSRNQYGALKLHPEHAQHLVDSPGISGERPSGATIAPVQDPAVGSMNLYEGSETGEGNAIPAKWQGSDPRKNAAYQREATRAGQPIAQPSSGQFAGAGGKTARGAAAATSGVSNRGYSRTETGKPVKMPGKV